MLDVLECPVCHELKALTAEFWHRNSASATGFQYACKPCMIKLVTRAVRNNRPYYRAYQRLKQREYKLARQAQP